MEAAARSTDRGDRSRRAILDAAGPVFAERGYAGASLNRIIRESGLTKGGFYFHFPSKLALALAVIDDHNERWRASVMEEVAQQPTAFERLVAVPRILARMALEGEGPAALRKLVDELTLDPELREEICGSLRIWVGSAAEQFRDAQREGAIRSDVDADLLAEVAVGAFVGMQTMTEQLGDGDLLRRIEAVNTVMELALRTAPGEGATR